LRHIGRGTERETIMTKSAKLCSGLKLLTPGNPKTAKGEKKGYVTFILHLAPARLSGYNVCSMATTGCTAACLNLAGRGGMLSGVSRLTLEMVLAGIQNTIQRARIRKTRQFFEFRDAFMLQLYLDVERAILWAEKNDLIPVFRLNGTSDIRWETVPVTVNEGTVTSTYPNIMLAFPYVQFYDYTKIPNRRNLPANYHLTFSLADGNDAQAARALDNGLSVAAVFRDKATVARYEREGFPIGGLTVPVHNGDETDLRFLDPRSVIIALYAKGNAKADRTGFVRD
jgi:hypothetical protein